MMELLNWFRSLIDGTAKLVQVLMMELPIGSGLSFMELPSWFRSSTELPCLFKSPNDGIAKSVQVHK